MLDKPFVVPRMSARRSSSSPVTSPRPGDGAGPQTRSSPRPGICRAAWATGLCCRSPFAGLLACTVWALTWKRAVSLHITFNAPSSWRSSPAVAFTATVSLRVGSSTARTCPAPGRGPRSPRRREALRPPPSWPRTPDETGHAGRSAPSSEPAPLARRPEQHPGGWSPANYAQAPVLRECDTPRSSWRCRGVAPGIQGSRGARYPPFERAVAYRGQAGTSPSYARPVRAAVDVSRSVRGRGFRGSR